MRNGVSKFVGNVAPLTPPPWENFYKMDVLRRVFMHSWAIGGGYQRAESVPVSQSIHLASLCVLYNYNECSRMGESLPI